MPCACSDWRMSAALAGSQLTCTSSSHNCSTQRLVNPCVLRPSTTASSVHWQLPGEMLRELAALTQLPRVVALLKSCPAPQAMLKRAGIRTMLNELSSTVVFERPTEEAFVRKWQLACEGDIAHVVVRRPRALVDMEQQGLSMD